MSFEDWVKSVVKESGRVYYYHRETRETRWDLPERDVVEATDESTRTPEVEEKVTWRVTVDSGTGRKYYYHPVTKETSWTNPNAGEAEAKSDAESGAAEKTEDSRAVKAEEMAADTARRADDDDRNEDSDEAFKRIPDGAVVYSAEPAHKIDAADTAEILDTADTAHSKRLSGIAVEPASREHRVEDEFTSEEKPDTSSGADDLSEKMKTASIDSRKTAELTDILLPALAQFALISTDPAVCDSCVYVYVFSGYILTLVAYAAAGSSCESRGSSE